MRKKKVNDKQSHGNYCSINFPHNEIPMQILFMDICWVEGSAGGAQGDVEEEEEGDEADGEEDGGEEEGEEEGGEEEEEEEEEEGADEEPVE